MGITGHQAFPRTGKGRSALFSSVQYSGRLLLHGRNKTRPRLYKSDSELHECAIVFDCGCPEDAFSA